MADLTLKDKNGDEIEKVLPGGKVKKKTKPQVQAAENLSWSTALCWILPSPVFVCQQHRVVPQRGGVMQCMDCTSPCMTSCDRSSSTRTHGTSGNASRQCSG